ncbi:hypothetical protein V3851_23750 [Paenibacillus sp. M1]|uniref:Uncharacterized protein n=1 Tax=Paenibacillus haidiansis TaxID=1574488 RepID=A0ABU7VYH5_9BACL
MLSKGRNTPEVAEGRTLMLPVKGGAKIFDGSIVAVDAAGFAVPGTKATGLTAAGRAEELVDNTSGTDGALSIRVRRGVFVWSNSQTGTIGAKDVLKNCYIEDDETVTITATSASIAGKVLGFEDGDVIVEIL